jgi:hypothetical protein
MERVFDVLNRLSAAGSATSYDEEAMIFGVDVLWGYLWHAMTRPTKRKIAGSKRYWDMI